MEEGRIGYRCSAEPVENYVAKGGKIEDTAGRKCLCNALLANIGHAQNRTPQEVEPALVTVGDDLHTVGAFLAPGRASYGAADVIDRLLSLCADFAEPVLAASA
jgi:nitronate monooxygenase